jgi:hypothetical protein
VSVVPCEKNAALKKLIEEYAEALKSQAHTVGNHGLDETEFYQSGLFRGAIERLRGQFSATMSEKREFVQHVLNHLQDLELIGEWDSAGGANRHDYTVRLPSGRVCAIELKGCLDGNNTNIFDRPPHADEFVVWSVCTNPAADPQHNIWSGIHTRLSAEIISREQQVDGLIAWDMLCGTVARPCPKLLAGLAREFEIGPFKLPPPCLYLFPRTIPSARNNPSPPLHTLQSLEFFAVLARLFEIPQGALNEVKIECRLNPPDIERLTTISRDGIAQRRSGWTPIRRS